MTKQKNLLFLTDFSEACFQAIPGIADWVDREQGELTLLHVHGHGRRAAEKAKNRMASFFAEADRYRHCTRTLIEGDLPTTVVDYCKRMRPDLVFAPATNPVGLPRLLHRSMRAELVRNAGVRIWTRGRKGQAAGPRRLSPDNVAYVVSGQEGWREEMQMAAQLAARHNARLHLICLTPRQEIHDGTLAHEIHTGLLPEVLREVELMPLRPELHASPGEEFRELRRLLREANADMVFAGERHVIRRGLFGSTWFNSDLERLDCEVMCFPRTKLAPETRLLTGEVFQRPWGKALPGGL